MKQSEKLILVVAGIAVLGFIYAELIHPAIFPEKKVVIENKVPDPVRVSVSDFTSEAKDETPELSVNAKELMGLEHELLKTGYKSKIAENEQTIEKGTLDINREKLEIKQMSGSLSMAPSTSYSNQNIPADSASTTVAAAMPTIVVNKINSNGTAIVTVNGNTKTVSNGMRVDGVHIVAIDKLNKSMRVNISGQPSTVYLNSSESRSLPVVEKLKSANE